MTTTQEPRDDAGLRYPPGVVDLDGHDLSYVDTGQGSAVLFIHGLLGSHANWAHLVDRLDTDHRVGRPRPLRARRLREAGR